MKIFPYKFPAAVIAVLALAFLCAQISSAETVSVRCWKCGGTFETDSSQKIVTCPYCGAKCVVPQPPAASGDEGMAGEDDSGGGDQASESEEAQAITWQEAMSRKGHFVVVEAKIVSVYDPDRMGKKGPVKLNVDRNWRDSLTFVLFNRDGKFGNPGRFLNQVVRVRGMVGDYKGAVQIKVESPGDIEIVTPDSEGPSEESTGTEADVVAAGDESISADSEESAAEAPEVESVEEAPAEETSSSAITWQEAVKKIGQQVTVEATIVSVYDPAARGKGGPVKLNTDRNWKESLTIVFYAKSRSGMDQGFGNPGRFLNKKVRVTGEVSEHQGAPQIMLRNPSQIEVIQ